MKVTLLILVFAFSCLLLVPNVTFGVDSAAPQIVWSKTYGHIGGHAIFQTDDGNFIVYSVKGDPKATDQGIPTLFYANMQGALMKIDPNGNVIWSKSAPVRPVGINPMIATKDGGFAMTGYGYSNKLTEGYTPIGLAKLNSEGNYIWNQQYLLPTQVVTINTLFETSQGEFIIAGKSEPTIFSSNETAWFIKTDSLGKLVWQKNIAVGDTDDLFGVGAMSMLEYTDGGYIFVGRMGRSGDTIVKLDAAGNVQWSKGFDSSTSDSYLRYFFDSIVKTSDGGYLVAGYQRSSSNNTAFVMKLDASFTPLWNRTLDGYGNCVLRNVLNDGYLFSADGRLLKTNFDCLIVWRLEYGSISSAVKTIEGDYILTGGLVNITETCAGEHPGDILVARFSENAAPIVSPSPTAPEYNSATIIFTLMGVSSVFSIVMLKRKHPKK